MRRLLGLDGGIAVDGPGLAAHSAPDLGEGAQHVLAGGGDGEGVAVQHNNGTAYLQADGTVLVYAGYDKFADGTWTLADGAIAITLGIYLSATAVPSSFRFSRNAAFSMEAFSPDSS